jgi:LmbE family N-acetylglucosaminyl deacetylase
MSTDLSERVAAAATGGSAVLVLSAHLDDAVLSCGALLSRLAGRTPVTVATLFTEAGLPPHTRAARSFLRQCAATDAAGLFSRRRQEDADVLARLGIEHVHLGLPDALFRRREVGPAVARIGRVLPELAHRYPTYRFDIDKGRLSRGDRALIGRAEAEVRRLTDGIEAALVLGPIGVGRHVDHLIARALTETYRERAVFYSDFPYDLHGSPDADYVAAHRLAAETWDGDLAAKRGLIEGYRTQAGPLFGGGDPPPIPETYFLPAGSPVRRRGSRTARGAHAGEER